MRHTLLFITVALAIANFSGRADAFASYPVRDYRLRIADYRFGFVDMNPGWNSKMDDGAKPFTMLDVGPAGSFCVPINASLGSAAGFAVLRVLFLP